MKRLEVFGEIYEAEKITATENTIVGSMNDGHVVFSFVGIKKPSDFVLLDGATYDQPVADSLALTAAIMGGTSMANENVGQQINRALQITVQTFTESQALDIADLYPTWEAGKTYEPDYIVKYGTKPNGKARIFRTVQGHKSQVTWAPGLVPALFKELGFTDSGVPIWVQPLGATDSYKINEIVMHNDKKWKSTAPNNVWEPGVYGWVEIPL